MSILEIFLDVKAFQYRRSLLSMKWFAVIIIPAICLISLFSNPSQAQTISDNGTSDNTTDNTSGNTTDNTSNNETSNNNLDLLTHYLDEADVLFKEGRYLEAISFYDKVSVIDPTDAEAQYGEARCYEKLGQYSDAITYYDKALANYQNYTEALTGKADVLSSLDKTAQAISYYNRALATDPRDTGALYGEGLALEKLGKNDQAIFFFDKILDIEPQNSDVLYQKGLALQSLGKKDEAISNFNKVLIINPQNTDAQNSRNIAMGLPPVNQKPDTIDNQILIVVGVIIAGIAITILIDKKRSRKKTLVTKPLTEEKNDNEGKIDESAQTDKKQKFDNPNWKGI